MTSWKFLPAPPIINLIPTCKWFCIQTESMSISLCLRGSALHRGLATVRLCSTLPQRSSPLSRGCASTRGRGIPFCTPRSDESALYPVVQGSTSFYAHYSTSAMEVICIWCHIANSYYKKKSLLFCSTSSRKLACSH